MTAGVLVDREMGYKNQVRWASGEPQAGMRAWFYGEVAGAREQFRVVTYRCTQCGALESFAPVRE